MLERSHSARVWGYSRGWKGEAIPDVGNSGCSRLGIATRGGIVLLKHRVQSGTEFRVAAGETRNAGKPNQEPSRCQF